MSFNETHRRGSSQAVGSHEGSWGDSLTHGESRLPQDQLNLSQQLSKKEEAQGATSRGNPKVRKKWRRGKDTAGSSNSRQMSRS